MTSEAYEQKRGFQATQWTVVLQASGNSVESKEALAALCESYWNPVYEFLKGTGYSESESRELTQAFFERLLSGGNIDGANPNKGRFRSYLLGAVKHFLSQRHRHANRLKRGGACSLESIEAGGTETSPGIQIADSEEAHASQHFDREWATTVVTRSLHTLERRYQKKAKENQFAVLKPWLTGDSEALSQATAAEQLKASVGSVKVAIHRLRGEFRQILEEEIKQTLIEGDDPKEELRYLIEVLS